MTRATLGFLFIASVSCNSSVLGGDDPNCPPDTQCTDPNNPNGPTETINKQGPGTGGSAFDPTGDGSGGVALDGDGNVILDPKGGSAMKQSVIWVANSADGTISKIDTRTMQQLSRYVTYPGGGADPSRTTVSLNGDVVVANRAWQNGALPTRASAVFIAGDPSGCVDRNGNGKIDTHLGTETVVPAQFQWAAGQAASPDECVVWITDLSHDKNGNAIGGNGTRPRAAGFDYKLEAARLAQFVYIGLYDLSEVVRLDVKTGAIVKRISTAPSQPYGLALDGNGKIWVMGRENDPGSLASIDPNNGDAVTRVTGATASNGSPCNYGITADGRGFIYTSWTNCLARFNPTTSKFDTMVVPGAGRLRGLGLDNQNNLFIADDQSTANGGFGMHHIDASPMPPAAGGATTMVYKTKVATVDSNVGVAIDFDNKPWVISTSNTATKIDPTNNYAVTTHTGVRGSYTYSDMSGYQLRNASRAGTFRTIFPGCTGGAITHWTNLDFGLQAPAGTTATVRYRGAATQAELATATWVSASGTPPLPIMLPAGVMANFLEVEINMTAVNRNITPVLSNLAAGFTCSLKVG